MKVTVKFENYGGGNLVAKRPDGTRFTVPGHAFGKNATLVDFANKTEAQDKITTIERRHPTIKGVIVDPADQEEQEPSGGDSEGGEGDSADMVEFGDFAEDATVEKLGGGWWSVVVEGFEKPFKVRGAGDVDGAILLAYEEYQTEQEGNE
jgi:hypothetical protein